MQRVIKFRGKSVADGSWVYGDLVHTTSRKQAIWPTEAGRDGGMIEVIPGSVGQYVNSRDRLGKEIYEGDIVRQKWESTYEDDYGDTCCANGTQTGIVAIRTRGVCMSPCLSVNEKAESAMRIKNIPVAGYRSEVIGNVTDNPLLFDEICNS